MTSPIIQQLTKECEKLNETQQLQVLAFVKAIKDPENRVSTGKDLLSIVGTIEKDDLILMQSAIKEAEKLDLSEW